MSKLKPINRHKKSPPWLGAKMWASLIAALLAFCVLQWPDAEKTFLGAPDRDMLQAAFKIRQGVASNQADPVLWLDLDIPTLEAEAKATGRAGVLTREPDAFAGLSSSAPRKAIARALNYARKPETSLVLLDVDLAWQSDSAAGNEAIKSALDAWASDPKAPMLLLAREVIAMPSGPVLPPTWLDEIVKAAPNIAFVGVSMIGDGGGKVREYGFGQCAGLGHGRTVFLPSFVVYSDAAHRFRGAASGRSNSAKAIEQEVLARHRTRFAACALAKGPMPVVPTAEGLVSWHLGFSPPNQVKAARVRQGWPWLARCGLEEAPLALARISVADLGPEANPSADTAPLCGRMVIIGADNPILRDRAETPIGGLPGPVILANAMRGHVESGPLQRQGWHPGRLAVQIMLLVVTVIGVAWCYGGVDGLREKLRARPQRDWWMHVILFGTHPLCFKFVVTFVVFGFGAAVTAFGIDHGFWGVLSAPAYCAALAESWRLFEQERARGKALANLPSSPDPILPDLTPPKKDAAQ